VIEKFYLKNLDVKVCLKYVNANLKLFRIWLSLVAYSNMIREFTGPESKESQ